MMEKGEEQVSVKILPRVAERRTKMETANCPQEEELPEKRKNFLDWRGPSVMRFLGPAKSRHILHGQPVSGKISRRRGKEAIYD